MSRILFAFGADTGIAGALGRFKPLQFCVHATVRAKLRHVGRHLDKVFQQSDKTLLHIDGSMPPYKLLTLRSWPMPRNSNKTRRPSFNPLTRKSSAWQPAITASRLPLIRSVGTSWRKSAGFHGQIFSPETTPIF